jgi:Transglutaminase-like superfamily
MKKMFLLNDVYAVQTVNGAVLLDLRSGQYFGLDLEKTLAIAPRIEGWLSQICASLVDVNQIDSGLAAAVIDSLSSGPTLLTDSPADGKPAAFPELRSTSAIPFRGTIAPGPKMNSLHLFRFTSACLRAAVDVRFCSLAATVRRVQARKSRRSKCQSPNSTEIVELVRVFRLLTPLLYSAKDHCLFDSIALVEYLAHYDAFPTWIIGVRTQPFAAHSWVQDGTVVLNERLEVVELYVPILTV